jgi:peptide/nickel transport system ATP-binding protein
MNERSDNLLEIKDLQVHFRTAEGVVRAVDGASFAIPRGKTVCVVGESGCGKSVTARAILQVVEPPGKLVSGQMHFHPANAPAVDLALLHPRSEAMRALRGKEIAMIYQEPMAALSPMYTIGNQIMEAIRWHLPVTKQEARAMTLEALTKVGIPRPHALIDAYTFQLSGGMRQRVMIAMALVGQPQLLIADEPTTALDVTTQANILDLIRSLQAEMGMSVMFITHDLGVVAEMAHEVVVMYLGTVVERGPVAQIFAEPKHPYTRALLRSIPRLDTAISQRGQRLATIQGMVPHPLSRPKGCTFHSRCDSAVAGLCNVMTPPAVPLADGREVRCLAYLDQHAIVLEPIDKSDAHAIELVAPPTATPSTPKPPLLTVKDLKMHFPITSGFFNRVTGHVKAVDGVSFTIHEGETLGLVGESGCGKTTLGHTLMRLYQPTAGEILYRDQATPADLATLGEKEMKPYRCAIRMIFQDPYGSLNPRLPVVEIIGEVLKVNGMAQGKELEAQVRALLAKVGLSPQYLRRYPHAFSGGQRQRIGIARALAANPRLIIADEPVSALDVSVQAQILNLLKALQAELGLTYLFISHDLSVVAHTSDRVAVMYVGKIVELAPTAELFQQPQHPYTEALLSAVLRPEPQRKNAATRIHLEGSVADPANPPSGCAFHPRCRYAKDECQQQTPLLRQTHDGHLVACHFAEQLQLTGIVHPLADSRQVV